MPRYMFAGLIIQHKNSVFNVEDFVAEGSLKNVMFVLNDTEIKKTYGYSVKHTRG